jgi:cobalamin biosynthesis protein CobC
MTAGRDWTADYGAFVYHGGALDVASRLAPGAPTPWIDLSTGINPHPYPLPDLAYEVWSQLPGTEALAELERAAAGRYGAPAGAVVAGPGSQALIQALAWIIPHGAVGVLGPTYGGLKAAFAAAGARVDEAKRVEDMGGLDVAVVVNPNNPDGRITPRADLLALNERLTRRGGLMIVDEAFADFDGEGESLAPALPAGAVVLRSFGKSFGLAGLRLGFAIASAEIGEPLRAALGTWPVSGPAIAIGTKALADRDWTDAMRDRLGKDAARLDSLIERAGFRIVGGTRLFRLAAKADARGVFERLLAAGILARPFAGAPDWLRFGIPGDESAWRRLAAAVGGRAFSDAESG